jgi:plasmid maintenance system antidote protein VapI
MAFAESLRKEAEGITNNALSELLDIAANKIEALAENNRELRHLIDEQNLKKHYEVKHT